MIVFSIDVQCYWCKTKQIHMYTHIHMPRHISSESFMILYTWHMHYVCYLCISMPFSLCISVSIISAYIRVCVCVWYITYLSLRGATIFTLMIFASVSWMLGKSDSGTLTLLNCLKSYGIYFVYELHFWFWYWFHVFYLYFPFPLPHLYAFIFKKSCYSRHFRKPPQIPFKIHWDKLITIYIKRKWSTELRLYAFQCFQCYTYFQKKINN